MLERKAGADSYSSKKPFQSLTEPFFFFFANMLLITKEYFKIKMETYYFFKYVPYGLQNNIVGGRTRGLYI